VSFALGCQMLPVIQSFLDSIFFFVFISTYLSHLTKPHTMPITIPPFETYESVYQQYYAASPRKAAIFAYKFKEMNANAHLYHEAQGHQVLIHMRVTPPPEDYQETIDDLVMFFIFGSEELFRQAVLAEEVSAKGVKHAHVVFFSRRQSDSRDLFVRRFKHIFPELTGNKVISTKTCYDANIFGYVLKDGKCTLSSDWEHDMVEAYKKVYMDHEASKVERSKRWKKQGCLDSVLQSFQSKGIKRPDVEQVYDEVRDYYVQRGKVMNPFYMKQVIYTVLNLTDPDRAAAQKANMIHDVLRMWYSMNWILRVYLHSQVIQWVRWFSLIKHGSKIYVFIFFYFQGINGIQTQICPKAI